MGVDVNSKMIYGAYVSDIKDEALREKIIDAIHDGDIDCASPWFDSHPLHWIFGISVSQKIYDSLAAIQIEHDLKWHQNPEMFKLLNEVKNSGVSMNWIITPDVT